MRRPRRNDRAVAERASPSRPFPASGGGKGGGRERVGRGLQSAERVNGGEPGAERCYNSQQGRLHGDMMDDCWIDDAVEIPQRRDGAQGPQWRQPPVSETHGVKDETFPADVRRILRHIGGDMHREAGCARSPRHRQAVRQEIPILGRDIDEAPRPARAGIHPRWPPDLWHNQLCWPPPLRLLHNPLPTQSR